MEAIEILKYIQERASGVGQAPNYTHKDFYEEMVKLYREELKELENIEVGKKFVIQEFNTCTATSNCATLTKKYKIIEVSNTFVIAELLETNSTLMYDGGVKKRFNLDELKEYENWNGTLYFI